MRKITIELTDEQASALDTYLLMTTEYRKGELKACERLAKELDKDGTVKFPNMADNAKFWRETNNEIEQIQKAIDKARFNHIS